MNEPTIMINYMTLNHAQAMTIRVALEMFVANLEKEGCGDDEHGKKITERYLERIREIREIMGVTV